MGDRASISFSDGESESVTLFDHWGGEGLFEDALEYANKLVATTSGTMEPLDRFEPNTVMLDFITGHIKHPVRSRFYLGKTSTDGDNSDNGHMKIIIDPRSRKVRNQKTRGE